jgi:hypothetical protein
MHAIRRTAIRNTAILCLSLSLLVGFGVGCSNDDNEHHPSTTNFYGTYADPGASGTIAMTGVSRATAPAQGGVAREELSLVGELTINGTISDLVGVWDTTAATLDFATTDAAYTFHGDVVGGQVAGLSNGPNGQGSFVLFLGGTASNVATFCGAASCTAPPGCTETGFFNFSKAGSASLIAIDYGGEVFFAAGSATASTVDIHIVETGVDVTIAGDISGSTMSGTFTDAVSGVSGTFTASAAQCTSAGLRR